MFYNDSAVQNAQIRDGISCTAMLCEVWGRSWTYEIPPPNVPQGCPNIADSRGMNLHAVVYFDKTPNNQRGDLSDPCNIDPWKASSFHPGGVHVAYADNSVHYISDAISIDVFAAMSTIAPIPNADPEPMEAPSD
jgi:hypothetical protein